jgi:uncharacterized membrane protein YfcA
MNPLSIFTASPTKNDVRIFPSQEFLKNRRISSRDFLMIVSVGLVGSLVGVLLSPQYPVEGGLVIAAPAMIIWTIVTLVLHSRRSMETRQYDPSVIGDPIALVTGWGATNRGWVYSIAHPRRHIVRKSDSVLEVRQNVRKSLPVALVFFGLLLFLVSSFIALGSHASVPAPLITLSLGLVVVFVGLRISSHSSRPVILMDKLEGLAREIRPTKTKTTPRTKEHPISEIHAVQLIDKLGRISGGKSGPRYILGWEVNLVLRNGSRLNILDSKSLSSSRSCAKELSKFLGIPVWESSLPSKRSPSTQTAPHSLTLKRLLPRHSE